MGPELLKRVEQLVRLDGVTRVVDGEGDSRAVRRHRTREDAELTFLLDRLLAGLLRLVGAVLQLGALVLQALLLVLQPLRTVVHLVEDADQVLLASATQGAVVAVGPHLNREPETEHEQQYRDDELGAGDPRRPDSRRAAAGVR